MSPEVYKILHVSGLMLVFLGLGGILLRSPEGNKTYKVAMALHGTGMLVMLVAGFGMLARSHIHWPWPGWVFAKVGCWVLIGVVPVMHRRGIFPTFLTWAIALAIGVSAAYLAVEKPF